VEKARAEAARRAETRQIDEERDAETKAVWQGLDTARQQELIDKAREGNPQLRDRPDDSPAVRSVARMILREQLDQRAAGIQGGEGYLQDRECSGRVMGMSEGEGEALGREALWGLSNGNSIQYAEWG